MKREDLETELVANGWTRDRWGHYQKDIVHLHPEKGRLIRKYRIKMQKKSCRLEVRRKITGQWVWLRLTSSFYTKALVLEDGRVRIGSMFVGRRRKQ